MFRKNGISDVNQLCMSLRIVSISVITLLKALYNLFAIVSMPPTIADAMSWKPEYKNCPTLNNACHNAKPKFCKYVSISDGILVMALLSVTKPFEIALTTADMPFAMLLPKLMKPLNVLLAV